MLEEGLRLMAVGMTTVFGMLTLLVAMLHVSAAVFARLPEDEPELVPDEDEELMLLAVAIAAAHRERSST